MLRTVHQRARDEDAALFARGHGADHLRGEMRRFHALERLPCPRAHFIGDVQIGPQRRRRKKSCDHSIEPRRHCRALAGQFGSHGSGADHAEVAAQLGQIPALAAEDAHAHSRSDDGIELAGHGEDERGFSASVGAENGDVLAGADAEVDVVQHHAITARHVHVAQFKKLCAVTVAGSSILRLSPLLSPTC